MLSCDTSRKHNSVPRRSKYALLVILYLASRLVASYPVHFSVCLTPLARRGQHVPRGVFPEFPEWEMVTSLLPGWRARERVSGSGMAPGH